MLCVCVCSVEVRCNLEGALHGDLMRGYNKNIRPIEKNGDITEVKLKMTLTNLISLNEKEETLTTCVWVEMQWFDYRLKWADRPGFEAYKNITATRIPSKAIWLPDIILENNVDGHFEITLYTNAVIDPYGMVYWLPPAIYHSACAIKVNYFPFDWQNCSMVFRSQTYSANEIELKLTNEENTTVEWIEIDPEAFTENGEWVIKHRPAKRVVNERYSRDELDYQELIFFLVIQRKPLFYVINIIVPCVLFSSLGLLVYFLPAKERGNGTINKSTVPLRRHSSLGLIVKADERMLQMARSELMFSKLKKRDGLTRSTLEKIWKQKEEDMIQDLTWSLAMASPELKHCVTSCKHIAETTKQHNDFQKENEEWFLVARVIDRLCFFTMALLFLLGTVGIFLMGHFNQAPALPFPGDPKKYLPETFTTNITDLN
ncbi:Acetylcholine receptor subunit gamma [Bagarius yarrelli]|uniref:Acetylcholine receptor subunit gamma n=1 Tax=Bagarius yarrelli TaxID=175774 RepID=A0A556V7I3_BAGYA|nr:Acetylcholine receptor subunit gamma [Bagarius yarrelli]